MSTLVAGNEILEACKKVCYDYLLSHSDPQHRAYRDRRLVIPTLKNLAQASVATLNLEPAAQDPAA
jgi:hypothetical protein